MKGYLMRRKETSSDSEALVSGFVSNFPKSNHETQKINGLKMCVGGLILAQDILSTNYIDADLKMCVGEFGMKMHEKQGEQSEL